MFLTFLILGRRASVYEAGSAVEPLGLAGVSDLSGLLAAAVEAGGSHLAMREGGETQR